MEIPGAGAPSCASPAHSVAGHSGAKAIEGPAGAGVSVDAVPGWMLAALAVIAIAVGVATLSQWHGAATWTPGSVFAALLIVAAVVMMTLAARAASPTASARLRPMLVMSVLLVGLCAWGALAVIFAMAPGVALATPREGGRS